MIIALNVVAFCLCAGWLWTYYRTYKVVDALQFLKSVPYVYSKDAYPKVSVIIAARNEQEDIARTVSSLLEQEGVDLEVIVVDDGSIDGTADILRTLQADNEAKIKANGAATNPISHINRLIVTQNKKLPNNWIGKNYALSLGCSTADPLSTWYLFTDADVELRSKRVIFNAIEVMKSQNLDHLALQPQWEAGEGIESFVLPLYVVLHYFHLIPPSAVNPESRDGVGIGAFNLVRAESYHLRNGHSRIRTEILDDNALGKMMRLDGGRGSIMRAHKQIYQRPYRNAQQLKEGISKRLLPFFKKSTVFCLMMGFLLFFATLLPPLVLASGVYLAIYDGQLPFLAFAAILSYVLPTFALVKARTVIRFQLRAALLFPIGAAFLSYTALYAAWCAFRGKFSWRERVYPC